MDKHKGTRTINSNTTADFHADYATLFVVLHKFDNTALQRVMPKLGMSIERNPSSEPFRCQVVGVLNNPRQRTS
jgi:hypothetical protein